MKKKLNVDSIRNELSGGSAFFPGYKGTDFPAPMEKASEPTKVEDQPAQQANARSPEPSFARTPVRSFTKRIITRNSFEIYEDQMDSLRKLSFKEKMDGKVGSMSAMVRDAIDKYLAENPIKK